MIIKILIWKNYLSVWHCLLQAIMDNIFYYGEVIILGNLPLKPEENDMFISVKGKYKWYR